jgi:Protein of unknown function (DUF2950)/Transposase
MVRKTKSKGKSNSRVVPTMHPDAAGVDIGAEEIFVAIPTDRDAEPVRSFGTFTRDLFELADWLQRCSVQTVAMESTGVYWIPLYQILETRGFQVFLVNAQHVKNVPGRKSDVSDCQWIQYLHSVGLLKASFRPPDEICVIRSLWRHRESLVQMAAEHTQHMQKALSQMNLHAARQSKSTAASTSQAIQLSFAAPKEAADALIKAAADYDVPALMQVLGPDGKDIVSSADAVRDKNSATSFVAQAREKTEVDIDPKSPKRAALQVGNEDWPFPIPIVNRSGKWRFDTKAGLQEILFRRIGTNELDAITICRGFVDAQMDYAEQVHDNSGVNQYAQLIVSTSGKQDGLSWKNPDGTWGGPVGESIAKALAEGYGDKSEPYHGYYFKVLKGQGPDAPLGTLNYVIDGAMIGGFALVAVPAQYRVTGVNTFIVSYNGVVYQKDLGPDSLNIVKAMERYNPDKTWHPTNDNW